jgi:hypothetical protein
MNMDIQVRVDKEKIFVDIPQKGEQHEFKNLLGLANGRVVSIGQSLADLIMENPQNEDNFVRRSNLNHSTLLPLKGWNDFTYFWIFRDIN